jgi:hypothetical protein
VARDPKKLVARATIACSGDKSGKISNDFAFQFLGTVDPTSSDWDNIANRVKDFYNLTRGVDTPICQWLSPAVSRVTNQCEIAIYQIDLADPHHYFGSPVHVVPWTMGGPAPTTPQPNEVSIVLSVRGNYGTDPEHSGSTRPRASDRGRLYLGPWGTSAIHATTLPDGTQVATVNANVITAISLSAKGLFDDDSVLANSTWSVWSRKEALYKSIVDYAIDTEFDTQRRRGMKTPLQNWIPFT